MSSEAAAVATPWVERYRPKSLDQVSHQAEVVATLQNAVKTGRLPHLLFYGPPGTGKTSAALALCRQLWHPSQWRRRVLELNASDERGISVVRDKIKHFASLSVSKQPSAAAFFKTTDDNNNNDETNYPNPPFKIIILDEADTVTPDAQAALRRIIEANSRITRFILICNYVTRIIEPLASRCAKFRFQPLPVEGMRERLHYIAEQERCSDQEKELIDNVLELAGGDMRRAVTTMQSVHSLAGSSIIDRESLAEIVGVPPPGIVEELWKAMGAPSFDAMQAAVENVTAAGYSAQLLLSALLPKLMASDLHELSKAEIAIRMAESEKNMIEGADEYLQLLTVCSLSQKLVQSDHAASN